MAGVRVSSVFRPMLFAGKAAIVTGGGTGIGKAIAQELLHLGCRVLISSRKLDRLEEAAKEMRSQLPPDSPAQLEFMQCNIRKEEEVKQMVATTLEKFHQLDFLINNAGGQFPGPAESFSLKGWNAVIETNLTGTFLVCREAFHGWMEEHGGCIVNIIADMFKGMPGMAHSGAARAGVDNITKSLAIEWAHKGIRINAIAPGSSIYSKTAAENYSSTSNIFTMAIPGIPAKRLGKPEEISAAVCFLLSPAAAFISGETVRIDGGHSLVGSSVGWQVPDHNKLPAYSWSTDAPSSSKSKL